MFYEEFLSPLRGFGLREKMCVILWAETPGKRPFQIFSGPPPHEFPIADHLFEIVSELFKSLCSPPRQLQELMVLFLLVFVALGIGLPFAPVSEKVL
jgi:hypothetical protein